MVTLVTLLDKGELDTLLTGQGAHGLLLTNHENVRETGGELVASGISNVSDLVRTWMVLDVLQDTNTTDVVSTSGEDGGTVVELKDGLNITGGEVQLEGVVLLDVWVWVADGAAIVGHDVWDLVLTQDLADDLAELPLGLVGVDGHSLETALDVVKHAEVLAGLINGHDILETDWELGVTSGLLVDLDNTLLLLNNLKDFLTGESVLKSVSEEHGHWDALAELVWALSWTGSVHTAQLIKAPCGWGEHSLKMLLWTSGHFVLFKVKV